MDARDQIRKIKELQRYVNTELPILASRVLAQDLVALVTNRVVQRGENFRGGKFSPYSTKTVPAFRFWGLSRTQSAEKKVRQLSRQKSVLTYQRFRQINNLKTGVKNFEFTGEMWRKFGIVRNNSGNGNFSISIGGTTTASQKKIDDNSKREGLSIIEASEKEKNLVQQTALGWITRQANRILGE